MVRVAITRRRARLAWIAVVVALVAAAPPWIVPRARAQQHKQVFVSVMEPGGTPVLDLKPADVKIFENEIPGTTVKVEPTTWPTKLTVLVDNGSRSSDYLANIRTGLRNFFNEIPDGVELSLISLAPQPRWLSKQTTDLPKTLKSIDLLAPDGGVGRFWDGLAEAGTRIDKDKTDFFPVVVLVMSDVGGSDPPLDQEYQRLQRQVEERGIRVHVVLITTGSQNSANVTGSVQTSIGIGLTKLSGGRFDNINSMSRLVTLLPEIGQQIAKDQFAQTHQYRVTYDPPASTGKGPKAVSVSIAAHGALLVTPTINGRLP